MTEYSLEKIENALRKSWSLETATRDDKWTISNPAQDQCVVTSLVINDFFGGDIFRCQAVGEEHDSHYFNILDDKVYDLTREQYPAGTMFTEAGPRLQGYNSTREYLLSNPKVKEKYLLLREKVLEHLKDEKKLPRTFKNVGAYYGYPGSGPLLIGFTGWDDDNGPLTILNKEEIEHYKTIGQITEKEYDEYRKYER